MARKRPDVTTNEGCVNTQKNEDLTCTAAEDGNCNFLFEFDVLRVTRTQPLKVNLKFI
jgi:hypothetical protein